MCKFIGSEVILANVLDADVEDDGVTYRDLAAYCERVKDRLAEEAERNGSDACVAFDLSDRALAEDLSRYPEMFRCFAGKYYRGIDFQLSRFRGYTSADLRRILKEAAVGASA